MTIESFKKYKYLEFNEKKIMPAKLTSSQFEDCKFSHPFSFDIYGCEKYCNIKKNITFKNCIFDISFSPDSFGTEFIDCTFENCDFNYGICSVLKNCIFKGEILINGDIGNLYLINCDLRDSDLELLNNIVEARTKFLIDNCSLPTNHFIKVRNLKCLGKGWEKGRLEFANMKSDVINFLFEKFCNDKDIKFSLQKS